MPNDLGLLFEQPQRINDHEIVKTRSFTMRDGACRCKKSDMSEFSVTILPSSGRPAADSNSEALQQVSDDEAEPAQSAHFEWPVPQTVVVPRRAAAP